MTAIPLNPVRSTSIAGIGYDHEHKRLRVKFSRSGSVYDYLGVSLLMYKALCGSTSIGKTLNKLVIPNHKHEKVEE